MARVSRPEERIAAVLHDVVEDSEWTVEGLRAEGFSEAVVDAVDALTRRDGEDYEDFVRRAGENSIGRPVKLADLADNSDSSRLKRPLTEADRRRLERYGRAIQILTGGQPRA